MKPIAVMKGSAGTPLILYSAGMPEELAEEAQDFGVHAVFEKPVSNARAGGGCARRGCQPVPPVRKPTMWCGWTIPHPVQSRKRDTAISRSPPHPSGMSAR
jgi:hypothetical protein